MYVPCRDFNLHALPQNDPELLETTITFRNMQSGGRSIVVIPLKVEQAIETQEGLAKAAYSRTFDAVVDRLNVAVAPSTPEKNAIGVLDIFGFEIFEVRSIPAVALRPSDTVFDNTLSNCGVVY
jgi:myosin heavy subunit